MQVYRGCDIGTAKLTVAERRGIPHHLIDIRDPSEIFSAGDYSREGRRVLSDIAGRTRIPILAGGTGFYWRALRDGLFASGKPDVSLRQRLRQRAEARPGSLHRLVHRFDPVAAAQIHPNDANKLIRTLEVFLAGRRSMTEARRTGRDALSGFRFLVLVLDPPRDAVYERINQRCIEMFQSGLLGETSRLLERGVPRSSQALTAVGYREAVAVHDGTMTVEQAVAAAQQATRNYAKRQWTWFRKEKGAIPLRGFGHEMEIVEQALGLAKTFLAS